MAEPFKICPICETPNHRNATVCTTCGTSLVNIATVAIGAEPPTPDLGYDYRYGETDLFEGSLGRKTQLYVLGIVFALIVLTVSALLFTVRPSIFSPSQLPANTTIEAVFSNTPRPTINLATVTSGPPTTTPSPTPSLTPTPTITPTPEPCLQRVSAEDTLIGIVSRCGHRDIDVIDVVLEINGLEDAGRIQIGQIIEVPWPTPTVDPNAIPSETPEGSASEPDQTTDINIINLDFDPFAPTATATLQPGVTWHEVRLGENIISVAVQYGATIEILSQLNPEVPFQQCDFGEPTGGSSCTVFLREGQLLRVPAPTPTPTLPPTATGSETPTPTPTPTFNAPSALSPDNREVFDRVEFITLRWIGTGTLETGQTYRLQVENLTTGNIYTADTQELFFVIPPEWQGQDGRRHEYAWTVSVIDINNPDNPYFTTESRIFAWQAQGESE